MLAVVIGVAFVAGSYVLTDTIFAAFDEIFSESLKGTSVVVTAKNPVEQQNGEIPTISASLLPRVKKTAGVRLTAGAIFAPGGFFDAKGDAIGTKFAPKFISSNLPDGLESLTYVEGHAPRGPTETSIDEAAAENSDLKLGEEIHIVGKRSAKSYRLVGFTQLGSASFGGASIAKLTLPEAQSITHTRGRFDQISVAAAASVSPDTLKRRIERIMPASVRVETAKENANRGSEEIRNNLGFLQTVLLVFGFVALFVGAFLIFNTFSITVGQRTRELALLRIVGASRRQVFRSVLFEALLLGVTASLVGIGLGVLTASGLEALIKAFGITLPSGSLVFQSRTVFAGLLVGVGVTVVSAISPARQAVKIPPIAAMSTYEVAQRESSARRLTIGAVIGVAGIVVLAIGLSQPAIQLVGIGAVGIFIAVGILAPAIARPVSSVLGRPLARILGVSGRIGRKNSMRSPRRTAQTSAALMVGMALVSTIAVYGASLSKSATGTVSDAVSADYIITAPATGGPNTGFSLGTTEAVAKVPGVTRVTNVNSGQLEISRSLATLSSLAPSDLSSTVILKMSSGAAAKSLAEGQLLIDTNTANTNHLSVGSVVPVTFAETGPTTMRIGGIFKPNALLGSYLTGSAFFHTHFAATTLPVALLLATSTGATPPTSAAVKAALRGYPNLTVQTRAEFQKTQQTSIDQLLGLIYALLALAILIALIGIVNTLMLSVFERTHEIGLLRAVGMRRRQIRAMIRSEALILSVFGALIGVVVGTGLGVALADSLKQQGITDIVIPFTNLVIFLLLAALLGLGAATWPARRAARLNVLEAIATE